MHLLMLFTVETEKKCQQKIEFKNQRLLGFGNQMKLCEKTAIKLNHLIEHLVTQKGYWRYDCLNVQLKKGDLTELLRV